MTPQAQAAAQKLLDRDHDDLTPPDFIHRSSWADAFRKVETNSGGWHYVDIPLAQADSFDDAEQAEGPLCPHPTLPGKAASAFAPADDCVADKILQFEAELKNPDTPTLERIAALKFLIHLIGDAHQPMHAVDNHDKGGNCVWLRTAADPVSLHGYWDTNLVQDAMGDRQIVAYSVWLKSQITPEQVRAWSVNDPKAWSAESAVLAHDVAYRLDVSQLPTCDHDNMRAPIDLPQGYDAMAEAVVRGQLEKAGIRLAMALNAAFDGA
jgi:hypothetical protein